MVNMQIGGSLALIIGTSQASTLERLLGKFRNATGPSARSLPGSSSNKWVDYLKPYGCWCNFDDVESKTLIKYGRGEPIDDWDRNCKRLQQGYECAAIDNAGCKPWELNFVLDDWETHISAARFIGFDPDGYAASGNLREGAGLSDPIWACPGAVSDPCSHQTCMAEYYFLMNAWAIILNDPAVNGNHFSVINNVHLLENYLQPNGFLDDGFERATQCVPKNGGAATQPAGKACCGQWPRRFSYRQENSDGNERKCCQSVQEITNYSEEQYDVGTGKVYDSTILMCCVDGSLGSAGSNC